jgi:pyruvate dehydrogenase E2 component (dihydrolipoamide acetyltransferase)
MARVVEMPKLSDTMEEGAIAHWLKKEGDSVKEGEPFVEIETDKATQEYEAPETGVLLKVLIQPGKAVPLRTPIAVIGKKGESVEGLGAVKAPPAPAAAAAPAATPARAATPAAPTQAPAVVGGRIKASPLAKKIAEDKGLDLSTVTGSGPGGRVVQKDVEGAEARGGGSTARGPAPVTQPSGADTVVPVTMMRKTIAKRLLAAKNDAPHFYLTVSADMTRAEEWRSRLNAEATAKNAPRGAVKISVNDIVVFACSRALLRHPMVNASWQGDTIVQHGGAHVAVAVALPEGLVTPVIKDTDRRQLKDIARATRELAERARGGKLSNEEMAGGTFTVSNLGMFGIESFTAIINPPQAAILAVGAVLPTPWAVKDEGGEDQLTVMPRMSMTMSCDHRVVDGATGAQFLKTLVTFLEDPLSMLG